MVTGVSGKKSSTTSYSEADARRWMTWLARQMQKHGYSLFLMEWLQPSWLSKQRDQRIYVIVTRMIAGFILGLATVALHRSLGLTDSDPTKEVVSMPALWGTIAGFATGIASVFRVESHVISFLKLESPLTKYLARAAIGMVVAAIGLLVIALPLDMYLFKHENFLTTSNHQTQVIVVLIAVLTGLVGVRTISRGLSSDIQSVETLGASWGDAVQGLFAGTVASFILGYVYSFHVQVPTPLPKYAWGQVIIITLVGMVMGTTFHGLKAAARKKTVIPNEGIVLSIRHSLVVGLALGIFGGGSWGICIWLQGSGSPLKAAVLGGVGISLISAIWFGGIDVMRHYVLRLILGLNGDFPFRPCPFLEYAEKDLAFIKQVGGGYQFMHRYLLEHFAEGYALPEDSPDRKAFIDLASSSPVFKSKQSVDESGQ